MSYLTSVTINGTEVLQYISRYRVNGTIDDEFDRADIEISGDAFDSLSSTDLLIGNEVIITRGINSATENYLFRGVIAEVSKNSPTVKITCYDKLWLLSRKEVTYTYDKNTDTEAGVLSEIAIDLITTYGGLNADSSSVQSSGTVNVLNKFICNHDKVLERLRRLAKTLDWQLYYNSSDDKVYFEPLGYTEYTSGSLTVGSGGNIVNNPNWVYDYNQLVNKFFLIGATRNVQTTETFTTDGAETTFQLSYTPTSVKVFVDTGSGDVLKTGGVVSSTPGSYDYTIDDDEDVRSVIFGTAPATGTATIQYGYDIPTPIRLDNFDSQNKYGVFENTEFLKEVKSVSDAQVYAQKVIDNFSIPFVSSSLDVVGVFGLVPGNRIEVVDTINNENRNVVVRKIIYKYPEEIDVVEVGDKSWKINDWMNNLKDRVNKLDRGNRTNERVLQQYKFDDNNNYDDNYWVEVRKNTIGEAFILGSVNKGVLGSTSSLLGKGAGWVENELVRMIPPNEVFVEDFGGTAFVNTTNASVTLDKDNYQLVFS